MGDFSHKDAHPVVAEQMPGVRAVLRRGSFPPLASAGPDLPVVIDEHRPPFADDEVRYYGQYVALAVADSLEQAKAAADAVRVSYTAETPDVSPDLVAEKVEVAGSREIPVEEILRRLQEFEDAQSRRLRHYQAVNVTKLRFQAASGVQTLETSFEGAYFFRQGEPADWAWQKFYINGLEWRSHDIPEIPLIQPEKAASMPLEILFTKEYRYSLRGTDTVNGRTLP